MNSKVIFIFCLLCIVLMSCSHTQTDDPLSMSPEEKLKESMFLKIKDDPISFTIAEAMSGRTEFDNDMLNKQEIEGLNNAFVKVKDSGGITCKHRIKNVEKMEVIRSCNENNASGFDEQIIVLNPERFWGPIQFLAINKKRKGVLPNFKGVVVEYKNNHSKMEFIF